MAGDEHSGGKALLLMPLITQGAGAGPKCCEGLGLGAAQTPAKFSMCRASAV